MVRVIYELDSAALPVEFMRALTTVGIPYLNIAFLGLVLNQLQQRASLQQVMLLIGIFLAVRFCYNCAAAGLTSAPRIMKLQLNGDSIAL